MPNDDGFPPDRTEWIVMRDRAFFAEDRVRIIREALGHREQFGWNPWRLRALLHAVRAALATGHDQDPEGP